MKPNYRFISVLAILMLLILSSVSELSAAESAAVMPTDSVRVVYSGSDPSLQEKYYDDDNITTQWTKVETGRTQYSYIKFDISVLAGKKVQTAVLKMSHFEGGLHPFGFRIYNVDDNSWVRSETNWNNKPVHDTSKYYAEYINENLEPYGEIAVDIDPGYFSGNGTYTMAIISIPPGASADLIQPYDDWDANFSFDSVVLELSLVADVQPTATPTQSPVIQSQQASSAASSVASTEESSLSISDESESIGSASDGTGSSEMSEDEVSKSSEDEISSMAGSITTSSQQSSEQEPQNNSSVTTVILIVVVVLIVGGIVYFVIRKKTA